MPDTWHVTSPLTCEQALDLSRQLGELIRQLHAGELSGSPSMVAMLRGACEALLVTQGRDET